MKQRKQVVVGLSIATFILGCAIGILYMIEWVPSSLKQSKAETFVEGTESNKAMIEKPALEEENLSGLSLEELALLGERYGSSDPLWGIELARRLSGDLERMEAFLDALFAEWAKHDARAAIEFILAGWTDDPTLPYLQFVQIALDEWSEQNPLRAAERMRLLAAGTKAGTLLGMKANLFLDDVLISWSSRAPSDAWEWLLQQSHLPNAMRHIEAVIQTWAARNPQEALEQGRVFEDGSREQQAVYNRGLSTWAEKNAEQAAQWFNENLFESDTSKIEDGISNVGEALLQQVSGEAAVDWLGSIPEKRVRETALEDVVFSWAAIKGSADSLEVFKQRINSGAAEYRVQLYEAANHLANHHPMVVLEWLSSQEQQNQVVADSVIEGVVEAISHEIPDVAYEWSTQIQDDGMRQEMRLSVLKEWAMSDADSLAVWLNKHTSSMSSEFLDQLTKLVADDLQIVRE